MKNPCNFSILAVEDTGNMVVCACACARWQVMQEVVQLLAPMNTTRLEPHGEGTDIEPWMQAGVPGRSPENMKTRFPLPSLHVS